MTREPRYLLDTNVVSDLIRNPDGAVARRLARVPEGSVHLSIVVACELRFGAAKSGSPRLARRVEQLLERIETLPLEVPVDKHYAAIRRALESAGTPIGPNDLLIASHALAMGLVLVTDNTREFSRVAGLKIENWLHPL